jgi:hypothetical protein
MKSLRATFALNLQELLNAHGLGSGMYRWFSEHVADDRYLRRWMSGEHLPGDITWPVFCQRFLATFGTADPSVGPTLDRLTAEIARARGSKRGPRALPTGHVAVRRAVRMTLTIAKATLRTTTEIRLECLVDKLMTVDHGVVVAAAARADLRSSTIALRSLTAGYQLRLIDVLPAIRSLQFQAGVIPPLTRGTVFDYRYVHTCRNYFPLSQGEVVRRSRSANASADQWCEKSYTITAPTDDLLCLIRFPPRTPRIADARVQVALWKSDTPHEVETRQLLQSNAVRVDRGRLVDEIVVHIAAPTLHCRYRILWKYST